MENNPTRGCRQRSRAGEGKTGRRKVVADVKSFKLLRESFFHLTVLIPSFSLCIARPFSLPLSLSLSFFHLALFNLHPSPPAILVYRVPDFSFKVQRRTLRDFTRRRMTFVFRTRYAFLRSDADQMRLHMCCYVGLCVHFITCQIMEFIIGLRYGL